MAVHATVILDSGIFLPKKEGDDGTEVGYFGSSDDVSDIRIVADGNVVKSPKKINLGKKCVIEIRHVRANGKTKTGSAFASNTFHSELLHFDQLYGSPVAVDRKNFDCVLRFESGLFCGAMLKPRKFRLHIRNSDGTFQEALDTEPLLIKKPIAHNVHVHFKLGKGETLQLARNGKVFWSSDSTGVSDRLEVEINADNSTAEKFYCDALSESRERYWLPNQDEPPPGCAQPPCQPPVGGGGGG
jgi:hypothetical protein